MKIYMIWDTQEKQYWTTWTNRGTVYSWYTKGGAQRAFNRRKYKEEEKFKNQSRYELHEIDPSKAFTVVV